MFSLSASGRGGRQIKVTKDMAKVVVGNYHFRRRQGIDFYNHCKGLGDNPSFGRYSMRLFLKMKESTKEGNILDLIDINGK